MLKIPIYAAIVAFSWTRCTFGFAPLTSRSAFLAADSKSALKYSDSVLEEQKEELKSRLPPVHRKEMSKLEIEFRDLLQAMLYTPQEMSSITNPRMRVIYEGVAASYYVPEVYRAFEVLYEDYMPLRVAGRMIHGNLQKMMDESKAYQLDQLRRVSEKTGFSLEEVEKGWRGFVHSAGDKELSVERLEQLVRRGEQLAILKSKDGDIMATVNPQRKNHLTFDEIVDGFMASSSNFTPSTLEDLLPEDFDPVLPSSRMDEKRAKYTQRYDDMLVKFGEWKPFIPSGEGRRLDILRGCFVGSENPQVVEALRVIYTDYSALRMSGDWIFKVVSTLMNRTMKRCQQDDDMTP
mmetsp:Transcript_1182/g.3100  ORF Transcript_1182/g.3100 Transcript_1182/m.3100 type:complete len:349 (+) Transcript_1182:230-1276(+)|eukprot:CAMPEP_0176009980 /NCGR_PEP_ID=MMETSP0120_2-20121206/4529_1 /TAXON_ID=160619 /ORGANISM="Kryptoperidinium foliaceum, Strain CCMP 1326" /LENGTH=348 /DNA_ID=CAMNT_0017342791 /DNA_START=220 /DNA_END=1266 /DNA_ORIENTATION=+